MYSISNLLINTFKETKVDLHRAYFLDYISSLKTFNKYQLLSL